jgi:transcriptional regulator with XRE-family HTH domain
MTECRWPEPLGSQRQQAEMTQQQLADRLGWDQKTISNIERGQHRVTLIETIELGEALGFDPAAVVRRIAKVND